NRSKSGEERMYDNLEDAVMEIEELKDELATITHTQTSMTGRDRWDTPETRHAGKKGKMRKDRYSSLLMCNMIARVIQRAVEPDEYEGAGGFAKDLKDGKKPDGMGWIGPAWFTEHEYVTGFVGA